ncbi:MAG: serine/threonine protein kinase [Myxococcales bacterium]|nr:serine/threonine protein kinase [Myxococcales bacterium]
MIDPLGSARMPDNQRYRITEKIDAGGMAEVYRGVAESAVGGLKKAVAIKRILPNLTKNKKFISMFLDEARVSMHLQHANIVGVFDIGIADTAYFIVMEYVDGANMKTIIESVRRQGQRMSVAHTLYLLMEVCKGLQYAHDAIDPETGRELGIVHRDISPPNILVSKRGEVKLVDFGLAKATSQLESTDPGVVKGKFSYLSPEAASGKEVDRRADIFAVGILLYEMLTSKRLFYGETDYQTVELVRQAKVPSISTQNAEVTPELEQIVRKALARDLNQRFQSAGDLQDALAQFLFSQRLKVTSRDIEQLVQSCLREKQRHQPKAAPVGNLIDTLINEEIVRFTSLDDIGEPSTATPSPAEVSGNAPLDPGLFVDTRGWADDLPSDMRKPSQNTGRNGALDGAAPVKRKKEDTGAHGLEELLEGDGDVQTQERKKKSSTGARPIANTSLPSTPSMHTSGRISAMVDDSTQAPSRKPKKKAATAQVAVVVVVLILVLASAGMAIYYFRH